MARYKFDSFVIMGVKKYDVIVIGAGIVGVSTAFHLQQKGQRVLLLDKKEAGQETSYGNAGIIDQNHVLPFAPVAFVDLLPILLGRSSAVRMDYMSGLKHLPWIGHFYLQSRVGQRRKNARSMRPLLEKAVAEHKYLLEGTSGLNYISDSGRVILYRQKKSFLADQQERDLATAWGIPFEILKPQDFQDLEPAIKQIFYKVVRHPGDARYINPGKAIACLAEKFCQDGGEFKAEEVVRLRPLKEDSWCVETQQGHYKAAQIVISTGPWTNKLSRALGHHFPIGIKRGYHQHFEMREKVSHTMVDSDFGYVLAPMEQGLRITTGAEFADMDAPHNPKQIEQVLPKAREFLSLGEAVEKKAWMGSRPCTPDSLPIIGQSRKHKGLWFNTGHGHFGITMGPATGRLLSEMMLGEETFCNPSPYSPERFGGIYRLR
ncbi:MAG: FAD-binding oxidoreductase [Alphaproteobacteria bacterium]|nr:FAD-binding oxidoreductase [Alphaproteobacteria bacterium]